MASKNSVKVYQEDSYYHVYNRGVEGRNIFIDQQDFSVFLSYLKAYLMPKDEVRLNGVLASKKSTSSEKDKALKQLRLKNYSTDIELVCYALLPNHFHLLIKQNALAINHFMNSIGTRYVMYFNRKYKRFGVLFQDVYKAVLINSEEQLLHLSRYIHLNPIKHLGLTISDWKEISLPSSLPEFLFARQTEWIKIHYVLDYFSRSNPNNTYEAFLGKHIDDSPLAETAIDFEQDY